MQFITKLFALTENRVRNYNLFDIKVFRCGVYLMDISGNLVSVTSVQWCSFNPISECSVSFNATL